MRIPRKESHGELFADISAFWKNGSIYEQEWNCQRVLWLEISRISKGRKATSIPWTFRTAVEDEESSAPQIAAYRKVVFEG
jgi:hypothetical protein